MWNTKDNEDFLAWLDQRAKKVERTGVCPDGLSETGHIVTKPIPDIESPDWSC